MLEGYDMAQICQNGHVVNSSARNHSAFNQKFCSKCGAATMIACPACQEAIRGNYHIPGVIGGSRYKRPAYCHECGSAYPWTELSRVAAEEMVDTFAQLTSGEREELKESIEHLLRETPRTRIAETKFKRLIAKVGVEGYEGLKSVLVDIVSETVRKTVFGPGS